LFQKKKKKKKFSATFSIRFALPKLNVENRPEYDTESYPSGGKVHSTSMVSFEMKMRDISRPSENTEKCGDDEPFIVVTFDMLKVGE
jgi:hypothetical protein